MDGLSLALDQSAGNDATLNVRKGAVLLSIPPSAGARRLAGEATGTQLAKQLGKNGAMTGLVQAPARQCVIRLGK